MFSCTAKLEHMWMLLRPVKAAAVTSWPVATMRKPLSSLRWATEDLAVQSHMPTNCRQRAMLISIQLHQLPLMTVLQAVSKRHHGWKCRQVLARPRQESQTHDMNPCLWCLTAACSHRDCLRDRLTSAGECTRASNDTQRQSQGPWQTAHQTRQTDEPSLASCLIA